MNYTLNFQKQLGDRELVRRGGELGPLETLLRIEFDDELGDVMSDASREDPPLYDFLVHRETGCIIPNCSTGLSTYIFTDKDHLNPEFQQTPPQLLWKLKYNTSYRIRGMGRRNYRLNCPEEMEIHRDPEDQDHFCIRPVNPVRPEIFRQMLRCLPWQKVYSFEEVRNIDERRAQLERDGITGSL
ncbi:uncharacterized protein [Acropora muricata]|uniref:uncharacterized protein n=1 Tax=Acropora muricata TaxID=159855 RepID=UPI0034E5C245